MKKSLLFIASLALIAACASTHAGTPTAGSRTAMTLKSDHINSFTTTLPVEVIITDSSSPCAQIEIPSAEIAEWVVCRIEGSALMIYPRKDAGHRLDALSSSNPIKVRLESSEIGEICNTSSAAVTCRNNRFARSLSISNTGAMRIEAAQIALTQNFEISNTGRCTLGVKTMKSGGKITLTNTGRIESTVERFESPIWENTNTGVIDLSSSVTANRVICTSTGRDNLSLEVKCDKLDITSTGAGSLKFRGSADNISVTATGSAHISTAEVRQPR
ncbi:MAG: DUF2807 domain-containing protein [Alistipes sp.]|nr:DUF2807 domain-containing protein [Alistipes sp.]